MQFRHGLVSSIALGVVTFASSLSFPETLQAQQSPPVSVDADDIGGIVTGPNGPEPGVWVIAETTDLPTRFTKSVVTDDQGRYVVPDLPTGQLSGLGARLWLDRLAEDAGEAGSDAESYGGAGAE